MGRPMSRNLLKAGHELTVYDVVPAGVAEIAGAGAKTAGSCREAAAAGGHHHHDAARRTGGRDGGARQGRRPGRRARRDRSSSI